jgi:DNA-binding transcriptional MerR regulator
MGKLTAHDSILSPAEVSEWFDIPRTTLFRWEREGAIPEAERRGRGERIFSQQLLPEIEEAVRRQIAAELEAAERHGTSEPFPRPEDQERMLLSRFISTTNKLKALEPLAALAERGLLSDRACELLISYAQDQSRTDPVRCGIWNLLAANDASSSD